MTRKISLLILIIMLNNFLFGHFTINGHDILDNDGNKIMLRGLGLGGWLVPEGYMLHFHPGDPAGSPTSIRNRIVELIGEEKAAEFYAEYLKNYVTAQDIQQIADWGYNHIRLPFSYKFLDPDTISPIFVDDGYEIIDQCLEWCKTAGLYMILDMHCAPGGQNHGNISDSDGTARLWTEEKYQIKIIDIWKEIAERYADEEWIIGYDLINEPVLPEGYNGLDLRTLYMQIRSKIRQVDNNHIIFIEGNWYASDFSYLDPIFDTKMVYSFHKYWSENDQASIQSYLNLRNKTGVPLWLGETGENSNHWFAEMAELAENNNIGWCNWTHKKFAAITSHYSASLPEDWEIIQNGNPTPSEAYTILMEFAENLKTEKCKVNPGVTPGYLDKDFLSSNYPVKEHSIPGEIFAVDYDIGGNGFAYLDNDYYRPHWEGNFPWNRGYEYRNDGVDIEKCNDPLSNGYNIGWTEDDEWQNYTVNVNHQGNYDITLRIAAQDGGKIQLFQNGLAITDIIDISSTGGWQSWTNKKINDIYLSEGNSEIKLKFIQGGVNISKMNFELKTAGVDRQPEDFILVGKNYPNPFNSSTMIPLKVSEPALLTIDIYNIFGQLIYTLNNRKISGEYNFPWNGADNFGKDVSAGIYFYKVRIKNNVTTGSMLLLK